MPKLGQRVKISREDDARALMGDLSREVRWGVNLTRCIAELTAAERDVMRKLLRTARLGREAASADEDAADLLTA